MSETFALKRSKIEGALTLALSSEGLQDLAAEYAELGLDALLESGIARDMPIVSTIVAGARLGATMRDRLLMKNILDFLGPMSAIPKQKRAEMITKLENDPSYGRHVGEHLIQLIDRIEAHRKPRMLAQVLRAYGAGEIDALMLHRLFHAVEHLPHSQFQKCEGSRRVFPLTAEPTQPPTPSLNSISGWPVLPFRNHPLMR